jgi:tetratricopeptide (TPR) repeat protein
VTYGNLLQYDERRRYAELALEHADRLAERERYYFEGAYYSNSVETLERAVEAYAKAIELYPDDAASRNNMAVQLGLLHRHEESIEHYEETLRRGSAFGGVRTNLVGAYLAIGDLDTARRRARDFMDAEPDSSASYIAMITVLMASGEYDEAERLLERHYDELPLTDRMGPAANLALAAEDWERMEALLARETSGGSPMAGVFAMYLRRNMALARGRSAEAASHMDSVPPEAGDFYWNAQGNVAELELERGDPAAALDRALRVRDETADLETRYWAVSLAARARVALGRNTAAESLVEELETLVARMPFPHQMRGHRLTLGYLALSRDEPAEALRLFESVVPDLESVYLGPLGTPYSSVFLGMGQANLLLGNANAAVEALETVLNSGALYSGDVLARVRAWFFLGQARDALGDEAGAREAFEKFLSYWGDGDIDRDRVAEARAYVAG